MNVFIQICWFVSGDSVLGIWLCAQRHLHRGSQTGEMLLPEREARLQALVDMKMLVWKVK